MKYLLIKRVVDLFFSTLVIFIFLLPILLVLFFSIIIDRHFPIFIQTRSGKNGKKIKIYKIKSMKYDDSKKRLFITKIGKFVRLTKLDEIPQFINVFFNDMSLIGPRPLYLEFNNYYKINHKVRLNVKPGLTGLAQIKIRDNTDWHKKFDNDVTYVKNMSFMLDIYILNQTVKLLFKTIFFKKDRRIEILDYKKNFMENYAKK